MDLQELERIKADARVIQIMLESSTRDDENDARLQAARDAGERITESCQRLSKRIKSSSPLPAPSAPEESDLSEKTCLMEQSRRAGEYIISFGKHKGKAVKAAPLSYLCWLLGVRRDGREFIKVSMDHHSWIVTNHPEIMSQVKAYLTWRCWACGSTDTRFKFSRLCPECWHNSENE